MCGRVAERRVTVHDPASHHGRQREGVFDELTGSRDDQYLLRRPAWIGPVHIDKHSLKAYLMCYEKTQQVIELRNCGTSPGGSKGSRNEAGESEAPRPGRRGRCLSPAKA